MEALRLYREKCKYDDPLASVLRIPYFDEWVAEHVTQNETTQLTIREISFSVLSYHAIYILAGLFLKLNSGVNAKLGNEKSRIDFRMRCVSFIQSVAIVIISIPLFDNEYLNKDHLFATVPYAYMYGRLATGYFLWDSFMSVLHLKYFGPEFLIHGVVSSMVCGIAVEGHIHYYAPVFLLFETSTPFLNVRWFGLKFPERFGSTFQLVNNIILLLIFFFVRICWGWYQIYNLTSDYIAARNDPRFHLLYSTIIVVSNLVLDVLNVTWFNKMLIVAVNTLKKMFSKEKQINEDKLKLM